MRLQKSGLIINITSIAGYMGLPYRGFTQLQRSTWANYRSTTNGGKIIWSSHFECGTWRFRDQYCRGRYHAPIIPGSAEIPYGNTLKTMDEHVDGGSNPNEMAKQFIGSYKPKNLKSKYKVGVFLCRSFRSCWSVFFQKSIWKNANEPL
jgi:hypothetical protein